jgi:hypothetical protein
MQTGLKKGCADVCHETLGVGLADVPSLLDQHFIHISTNVYSMFVAGSPARTATPAALSTLSCLFLAFVAWPLAIACARFSGPTTRRAAANSECLARRSTRQGFGAVRLRGSVSRTRWALWSA